VNGNATSTYRNVSLLSVSSVLGPLVTTSVEIERKLEPILKRLRLPVGLLERVAGVIERRNWGPLGSHEATVQAGEQALRTAGVEASSIGLLINTSITKEHLEPSVATRLHHGLGLPTSAINFDISNACLGFVNGLNLAAGLIDAGQVDYAMVIDGEDVDRMQKTTIERLAQSDVADREEFMNQFASLTLGSGAAAAVLGRADRHPEGHRMLGGVTRAATEWNELCIGSMDGMTTDSKSLLRRGMEVAQAAWNEAKRDWNWSDMDRYIMHQVSSAHTAAFVKIADIDAERVPTTYPTYGNVGSASIPITLAAESETLQKGERVLLCGIGSGINTSMLELAW
jgi:acyl-CoA:acyl-CoA alkyltransferase